MIDRDSSLSEFRYWYAYCGLCDWSSTESPEEEGGIATARADRDAHLAEYPDHHVVIKEDTVRDVE